MQEIEKLLDKYFNGETSLEEEKALRELFSRGDLPAGPEKLRDMFGFYSSARRVSLDSAEFDRKLDAAMKEPKLSRLTDLQRPWIYWASGVAATILILVAIFVRFDPISKPIRDTYNDPEMAYQEATKILLFVADRFNKGTSRLEPVSRLETGINSLKPVSALNKGLNEMNRLEILDAAGEQKTIN